MESTPPVPCSSARCPSFPALRTLASGLPLCHMLALPSTSPLACGCAHPDPHSAAAKTEIPTPPWRLTVWLLFRAGRCVSWSWRDTSQVDPGALLSPRAPGPPAPLALLPPAPPAFWLPSCPARFPSWPSFLKQLCEEHPALLGPWGLWNLPHPSLEEISVTSGQAHGKCPGMGLSEPAYEVLHPWLHVL